MRTVQSHPQQKTEFLVRAGESKSARAVYRGDHAGEAHNVARATPNATITFRSQRGVMEYLHASAP